MEWKTCWVSPGERFLRNGDKREELGWPQRPGVRLVSMFGVLIYIFEMGGRNLLALEDKREENSREGQFKNECK